MVSQMMKFYMEDLPDETGEVGHSLPDMQAQKWL